MKSILFIMVSLFIIQYASSNENVQAEKDKSYESQILFLNNECCQVDEHGNISIVEGMDGTITKFAIDEVDPKETSEKIVKSMKKKTALSEKASKELVEKLSNDPELRFKELYSFIGNFKMFVNKGSPQEQTLEISSDGGFKRTRSNKDIVEFFDKDGKIVKIENVSKKETVKSSHTGNSRAGDIGFICQLKQLNKLATKEIQKEKKAGKISGYVNATRLQQLGKSIVDNDENIEMLNSRLKKDHRYTFKESDCK